MVLIRRNTLRYCALRGLSAVNNRFGFPGLRRFAANPGYINIDYFNSENETAADGRRLHCDVQAQTAQPVLNQTATRRRAPVGTLATRTMARRHRPSEQPRRSSN